MQGADNGRVSGGKRIWPVLVVCAAAFLVAGILSKFCFQLVLVQGDSMEPAYHNGQIVVVNKLDREYRNGDVIVFYSENDGIYVIKRIAACPGERVMIVRQEDGESVQYLLPQEQEGDKDRGADSEEQVMIIPADGYYVLGDNREHSIDSRDQRIGIVRAESIIGKVL